MTISYSFSFANCLRHAFMSGAGYGELERITEEDQRRWCSYDPPEVGSFAKMAAVLEFPKLAHNLADWVEASLQCKSWHWDEDQFDAALHVLNEYRAAVGKEPYQPNREPEKVIPTFAYDPQLRFYGDRSYKVVRRKQGAVLIETANGERGWISETMVTAA